MVSRETIFFDVDTQFDFLDPQGKLYIPGAVEIIPSVEAARKFAFKNGYSIIASQDWHSMDNPEISLEPDFKETFPPHCIVDSPGARRIGWLGPLEIISIPPGGIERGRLVPIAALPQFHVVFRKDNVDVFTNPSLPPLLGLTDPAQIVIFGVALDVCVEIDVNRFLEHTRAKLFVITDAIKGLGIKSDESVYADFRRKGVNMSTVADLDRVLAETSKRE
jgi:nicotinamidase/pyrazinamidase